MYWLIEFTYDRQFGEPVRETLLVHANSTSDAQERIMMLFLNARDFLNKTIQ